MVTDTRTAPPPTGGATQAPAAPSRAAYWRAALVAPLAVIPLWVALAGAVPLPPPLATPSAAVLILALAASCVTDVRGRRIFNWTTYTAVLWAVVLQAVAYVAEISPGVGGWLGVAGFVEAYEPARLLFGLALGFGLMLALYVTAGGGGGDLKLVAAAGCVLGPPTLLEALAGSYISAGVLAASVVIWKVGPLELGRLILRKLAGPFAHYVPFLRTRRDLGGVWRTGIPMAPFYTIGILLALWKWPHTL